MKDKNGKNVSHVETNKLVIAHCNIVNNNYQKDLWVFYKFVINKLFGRLLDISPNCSILLKIFNSEFLYIEVWFTDHNSKALEIDDKMNIISVTNWFRIYKIGKNLRGRYRQTLLDYVKKSDTGALKTTS